MRAVVVGAGRVGRRVAERLSKNFEVTVVDRDPSVVEDIEYNLDVMTVEGDATLPETLEEAEVEGADYVIATTDDDHINIIVCSLAKSLSGARTVARVKNMDYLRVWGRRREALGVDLMVCSTPLVASSIVNVLEFPQLRLLRPLYGGLYVGDALSVPTGLWNTEIRGRRIIAGTREEIESFYRVEKARNVLIMGGGETGVLLASLLVEKNCDVKLVERDRQRAELIAGRVEPATVIIGNVFNPSLWRVERLYEADVVVSSLGDDGANLLASLMARKMGVKRVFSIVHEGFFTDIFEGNGVVPISPEVVTAERIVLAVKGGNVLGVVSAIPGVTVLAVRVGDKLEGNSPGELGAIVGPVIRNGEVIIPTSDFRLHRGDVLTLFVENERLGELNL